MFVAICFIIFVVLIHYHRKILVFMNARALVLDGFKVIDLSLKVDGR